jgi:hypothetical protein
MSKYKVVFRNAKCQLLALSLRGEHAQLKKDIVSWRKCYPRLKFFIKKEKVKCS